MYDVLMSCVYSIMIGALNIPNRSNGAIHLMMILVVGVVLLLVVYINLVGKR